MSKVNISKIIEGVGTCSENLIGISENLISISEKVSVISKVIAEIISEFQTEADKPAIETKTKKPAAKQIEAKAEPVKETAKEYTFTEVRTILAEKSRAGHTSEIKKILVSHGAEKLSEIDPSEYAAIVAEVEVLGPVLIIAAIAALVALIYLWNNSDEFRQFWIDLWENIKEIAVAVWKVLKEFFVAVWEFIKTTAETVWNALAGFFTELWEEIKNTFIML